MKQLFWFRRVELPGVSTVVRQGRMSKQWEQQKMVGLVQDGV